MISYKPLFRFLFEQGINKTTMKEDIGISPSTLAKMGKNEYVSLEVVDKICSHYNLQPGQVLEWKENE